MDVISITSIASGIANLASKVLGIIKDSTDNTLKVELTNTIIELQQKILDIQSAAIQIQEDNKGLKEKIEQLEDTSEKEKRIEWTDGKTYGVYKYEDGKEAHICLKCWNVKRTIVHIMRDGRFFICPACENKCIV